MTISVIARRNALLFRQCFPIEFIEQRLMVTGIYLAGTTCFALGLNIMFDMWLLFIERSLAAAIKEFILRVIFA